MTKKKNKRSRIPSWRIFSFLAILSATLYFIHWLFSGPALRHLGPGTLIFCMFPIAVCIRLIVRNSRLSIIKALLICGAGGFTLNMWSQMSAVLVYGPETDCWMTNPMGAKMLDAMHGFLGTDMLSYIALTAALFVCIVISTLKVWTSLYRYIVNKPYVREIVREVSPAPAAEIKPRKQKQSPVVRDDEPVKPAPAKRKISAPIEKPRTREFGEDELPKYQMPSASLLKDHSESVHEVSKAEITRNIETIRTTLSDHHVKVTDIRAVPGPTVTLYKVYPDRGVSVGSIMGKANDLSVALQVDGVRTEILKDSVGIEVPNDRASMVPIKSLVTSEEFVRSDAELPIPIGLTVDSHVKVFDLTKTPHLLVAGATQQGKSVGLNVMISSLLYAKHPSELQFVFVDPKGNEFNSYKHLYKHYLAVMPGADGEEAEMEGSVCVKPKDADIVLRSLCAEMTERYDLMRQAGSTPNIKTYNEKYKAHKLNTKNGHRYLPYIVAVIDEYADLTMSGSFTPEGRTTARNIMTSLILLASKGRAAGIHLIIATQTPRKDVISGVIKANFPTQIAFKVSNNMDSRVILDSPGAEKLLGNGDMLYSQGARIERIQCGYIGPEEITALALAVESQKGFQKSFSTPYYLPEVKEEEGDDGGSTVDMKKIDARFEEAARFVVETQKASTSYLQTNLGMGFAKSARVMQQLEAAGIVSHQDGAKAREVLVKDFAELEPIIKSFTSH